MEQFRKISMGYRVGFWFLAWFLAFSALIFLADIKASDLGGFILFPIGLVVYLNYFNFGGYHFFDLNEIIHITLGWLFYLLLTIIGLQQTRRERYFFIYIILCLLLTLNVVSCNGSLHFKM